MNNNIKSKINAIVSEQLYGTKVRPNQETSKEHTDVVMKIQEAKILEYKNGHIKVEILKHNSPNKIGDQYWIKSEYLMEV